MMQYKLGDKKLVSVEASPRARPSLGYFVLQNSSAPPIRPNVIKRGGACAKHVSTWHLYFVVLLKNNSSHSHL